MRNGFPDYHQFPDRDHGDESFWPSFTDIMMVITMVFLLVTVMAITNNWKLVTDLKTSIQAERLAAEQALDSKAQTNSLEDQMIMLQKRLVDASKVAVDKQVANDALQKELSRILARVSKIEQTLEATLKTVAEREKQLELSSQQVNTLRADRDKQLATLATRAQALTNLQSIQETSQQQVMRLQAALDEKQAAFIASEQDKKTVQLALVAAQTEVLRQQAALKAEQLALQTQQAALQEARTGSESKVAALEKISDERGNKIKTLEQSLARANAALLASQASNETALNDLQAQLRQTQETLDTSRERLQLSDEQLDQMRAEVIALEQAKTNEASALAVLRSEMSLLETLRAQDEAKLQSLKGEFDTLDTKYQKLVRPARSSNGKHVVSVWYSKQTGRDVYRIRDSAKGSFVTTTRQGMASKLAALKDKHGKALYVKVIIPENSALSYSDAWRFTTEMQRAYDYYYQDDE